MSIFFCENYPVSLVKIYVILSRLITIAEVDSQDDKRFNVVFNIIRINALQDVVQDTQ